MKMTFGNGYAVKIDKLGYVTRWHKGKTLVRHSTEFREVMAGGRVMDFLTRHGLDSSDYMELSDGTGMIRAGRGVRLAILNAVDRSNKRLVENEGRSPGEWDDVFAFEVERFS